MKKYILSTSNHGYADLQRKEMGWIRLTGDSFVVVELSILDDKEFNMNMYFLI